MSFFEELLFNLNPMNRKKMILLFLFITGALSLNLFADQPDPPGPPNPGGSPVGNENPVGAPVDGGVVFLMVLGAVYGSKTIRSMIVGERKG